MKTKKTKHCAGCRAFWGEGVKDGKHDNWCCKFGRPCQSAVGHCKNVNGKELKS